VPTLRGLDKSIINAYILTIVLFRGIRLMLPEKGFLANYLKIVHFYPYRT